MPLFFWFILHCMALSLGIVGLPNSGKSTLFQALTRKQVLIASYPFATIDPNKGIVPVPDERLDAIAEISKPKTVTPTTIEFVDIAGLVRGAAAGEGLGNAFLGHIREADAIVHVVREFSDPNVPHVHGKVDPKDDIAVIELELILADKAAVEKRLEALSGNKAGEDRKLQKSTDLLERVLRGFDEGKPARVLGLGEEEHAELRDLYLLTLKPVLFVYNAGEENPKAGAQFLRINAKQEAELADLSWQETKEYLMALGRSASGLDLLIVKSYALCGLITFFTTGPKETRAWTVTRGTKAPQAAGVIHSDFERGFIRVEVGNWEDFVKFGGETGMKRKGLWRLEGKEYVIQDGDVCYFRFSV